MSTELISVLVGGPGLVALVVAVLSFFQNRRTLKASQPKTDAEKMQIEITYLRSLLEESRTVRQADKQDFEYRIAELRAELREQKQKCEQKMKDMLDNISRYLEEHSLPRPRWWPAHHRPVELELESKPDSEETHGNEGS